MTIASAFNDIAVAQGGTAAKSGAITALHIEFTMPNEEAEFLGFTVSAAK